MNNNGKADLARQYREQYGWDMPSLKLARIMYKDNPLLFKDVEMARYFLRYIEGKAGRRERDRKGIVKTPERPRNPYKLPDSDETTYDPYKIVAKRVLVLSDIHIPYHSIDALSAAFDYAKDEKPDAILLNGDTIDFHGLSRFVKDPKARSFAYELSAFRRFFEVLSEIFQCRIYFKLGNHEERYNHFLMMKASELEGVEEFSLENIIKARAEGIEVIGDKRIIKLGDLNVIHGHEFGGSIFSPVNIARGLFLRGKVSAMQGHNHQTSEHTETNMNRDITTTWSLGCLCELFPSYLPINRWNHGFSIVDIDGNDFHVRNKRIDKGKVL
jgi:predicted phosphodiesterase